MTDKFYPEQLDTPHVPFLPPKQCERPYSISEVNAGIAQMLESGTPLLWVQGEISNFHRATSGHSYFTLKDDQGQIPSVMWRTSSVKLKFQPENGMEVMVIASLRVYQKGGYYQLDVQRMQPAGLGALYAAYEQLKKRLEAEGLFDPARKRQLPETISTLGIITSKQGAAVRDIIKVVRSRSPQTDILLIDVQVQGEKAAPQIAAALADMNAHGVADCIIVGRGGGSIEDLWAFNEEVVARAIAASRIPVISAVGHEIDFTIADFVADVRAPTPSAAAEIAVADTRQNKKYFDTTAERFRQAFVQFWDQGARNYRRLLRRSALRIPLRLMSDARQSHDDLQGRLLVSTRQVVDRLRTRLTHAAAHLNAVSPLEVLSRGYAVVIGPDKKPVKNVKTLSPGDQVELRFNQGRARSTIDEIIDPTSD